jgi:hypothetical protein
MGQFYKLAAWLRASGRGTGAAPFGSVKDVDASEISLIVSGIAAGGSIAAVAISYRLGVKRFEHERRLADLDAVRLVIDEAAAKMQTAHSKMAMIYKHLGNYAEGAKGEVFPLVREHRFQLEEAHNDLEAQEGRLEIRFGPDHDLANICRTASSQVLSVAVFTHNIEFAPDPRTAIANDRETITQAILRVGLAREEFKLSAHQAIGVRLPAKPLDVV